MNLINRIVNSYKKYNDYFQTILFARYLGIGPKSFYGSVLFNNWKKRNSVIEEGKLEDLIAFPLADIQLWITNPLGAFDVTRYLRNEALKSLKEFK